jgi:hypothetical protein
MTRCARDVLSRDAPRETGCSRSALHFSQIKWHVIREYRVAESWYKASAQTRDLFCDQSVRCFDRARLARLSAKMFEREAIDECEFLSRRH